MYFTNQNINYNFEFFLNFSTPKNQNRILSRFDLYKGLKLRKEILAKITGNQRRQGDKINLNKMIKKFNIPRNEQPVISAKMPKFPPKLANLSLMLYFASIL